MTECMHINVIAVMWNALSPGYKNFKLSSYVRHRKTSFNSRQVGGHPPDGFQGVLILAILYIKKTSTLLESFEGAIIVNEPLEIRKSKSKNP